MHRSKELLIGVFAITVLVISYWGVNFLKGENLFSKKRVFYAVYDNIDGLTVSRPVTINGFKVGQVSNITFDFQEKANLVVEVSIDEDILFSTNSILEIYDSDIMGSKSLQLKLANGETAVSGDTLIGEIATGLTSEVSEQFGSVKVSVDQLIISFDKVLKEVKELSNTSNRILLHNEERLSNSVNSIESISSVIQAQSHNINNTISNVTTFSDSLNSLQLVTLSENILKVSNELELFLYKMNNGDGSFSKLINQDSLYKDMSHTINSLDQLINDIKQNPKKYINISIWNRDKKGKKQ